MPRQNKTTARRHSLEHNVKPSRRPLLVRQDENQVKGFNRLVGLEKGNRVFPAKSAMDGHMR